MSFSISYVIEKIRMKKKNENLKNGKEPINLFFLKKFCIFIKNESARFYIYK